MFQLLRVHNKGSNNHASCCHQKQRRVIIDTKGYLEKRNTLLISFFTLSDSPAQVIKQLYYILNSFSNQDEGGYYFQHHRS